MCALEYELVIKCVSFNSSNFNYYNGHDLIS